MKINEWEVSEIYDETTICEKKIGSDEKKTPFNGEFF
jgi:hypothetical protein